MKESTWNQRFLATSRGRIIRLLRKTARTVNDLAAALDLTDNAVRAHLATLERDGLVHPSGQRKGARKPHTVYGLTQAGEDLFPKAYGALLGEVLDVLDDRLSPEQVDGLLREVGHRLAGARPASLGGKTLEERVAAALDVLGELGGEAEVQAEEGHLFIRGDSCPLSAVIGGHPEACRMAETLVAEIVGVPVRERCEKGVSPRCCFEIGGPGGAEPAIP